MVKKLFSAAKRLGVLEFIRKWVGRAQASMCIFDKILTFLPQNSIIRQELRAGFRVYLEVEKYADWSRFFVRLGEPEGGVAALR